MSVELVILVHQVRKYNVLPLIIDAYMSLVMRKPAFCTCENKDADQLRGNREADQRLCFRYKDSTIPLLPKPEISSIWPSSLIVQPGLCRTWSETPKTGFLRTRLISPILSHLKAHMSRVMRKPTFWFPTWSDTNQAVQSQKMAKGLKFQI